MWTLLVSIIIMISAKSVPIQNLIGYSTGEMSDTS